MAWAQPGAEPFSPRGNPGRRPPRCRSAAPGGHKVAIFAVLRAPGRVPRAGAAPDLALAGWPPAWTTLMARAREARARTPLRPVAPVWICSASARQCSARDNALPERAAVTAIQERGIHVVAARPGVFVHSSHLMNTTAPAAIPGRRPFSAGAHIAHGTLTRPHRDHTLEERGVERSAASLDTHGHARRSQSSARSAGPVWRARARRCARASPQLGQGIGLGALTARGSLLRVPPHGTYTRRAWRAGHGTSPRHHAGRRTGPPVPPALPAATVWRTSAIFRKPQRFSGFSVF